jgi:hypothetical protein
MIKFNLKNKIIISIFVFVLLAMGHQALASTTNGTINDTYRYGWGENIGWVDFGSTTGDIHITDDALTGYIWGENIGWINLTGVINDKEGHLSGYAWGENVGWIDFSQVTIDSHGYFLGQAYGENIGFITFNKDNTNNVITDYRPKSSRSSSSSGGSSPVTMALFQAEQEARAIATGQPLPTPETLTPFTPPVTTPTIIRTLKLTTPRMTGQDVKDLQTYLNSHTYNCGLVDGIFGKLTKQAVILFQKANNLKQDGIVGPLTRSKLK